MPEIHLQLPFPPTNNTYYRNVVIQGRPRTLISKKGRLYATEVLAAVCFDDRPAMDGDVGVVVDFYPPDKRKRDVDNLFKAMFDGLSKANVWNDDSQVKSLTATMHKPVKGGRVNIRITGE